MVVKKVRLKDLEGTQKKKKETGKLIKKKKSIKEIDIGTGAITGEEIKPVKKKKKLKGLKSNLTIMDEEVKPLKNKKSAAVGNDKDLTEKIKQQIPKDTIQGTKVKHRKKYYTHNGHELTIKEYKFIDLYIQTGNVSQSVIQAGYESKAPSVYGNEILQKPWIADEVEYRMTQEHKSRVADGNEVMEFFSKVMRGEVKDQFGLDAPLSERLKAGNELAKRTVDIANKVAGVTQGQNEVTIKLDFDRSEI